MTERPKPTNPRECDPYTKPAHLNLNTTNPLSSYLKVYDLSCQPTSDWVKQVQHSLAHNFSIPALTNKELLLVGDSIDQRVLFDLCDSVFGLPIAKHHMNNYDLMNRNGSSSVPHSCRIPHLNTTIHNFFFFGFDETDMWKEQARAQYSWPGKFSWRWKLFAQVVRTLPSGGRPDLVVVNVGYWELMRQHALARAGTNSQDIGAEFQYEFVENTEHMLRDLRAIVGPKSRIRFRENHTPGTLEGSNSTSRDVKSGNMDSFSAVKVDTINALVDEALRRVNKDDVDIALWPIGKLMRPWPWSMWLEDDFHPKPGVLAGVWGEGLLEMLARAPRVWGKDPKL